MSGELVFSPPSLRIPQSQEPGPASQWDFSLWKAPASFSLCPFFVLLPWFMSRMHMMLRTKSVQTLLYCPASCPLNTKGHRTVRWNKHISLKWSFSICGWHAFICSWSLGRSSIVVVHPASKWYTENLVRINISTCCHSLINGNYHFPTMQKYKPGVVCEMNCPRSQSEQKRLGNLGR